MRKQGDKLADSEQKRGGKTNSCSTLKSFNQLIVRRPAVVAMFPRSPQDMNSSSTHSFITPLTAAGSSFAGYNFVILLARMKKISCSKRAVTGLHSRKDLGSVTILWSVFEGICFQMGFIQAEKQVVFFGKCGNFFCFCFSGFFCL